MEIKVYADVLFFTNLFMDFLLLYISALLIKAKRRAIRIAVAAGIGAVYSTIIFFVRILPLPNVFLKLLVGGMMVYIAFLPHTVAAYIKQASIFFAVSFCCGGIGFGLLYFTDSSSRLGVILSGGTVYFDFPVYKLMLSCAICYGVLNLATAAVKKYKKHAACIYDITLFYGGKQVSFKALYDSGNSLKEAKTDRSVLVVFWDVVKELFDTEKNFPEFLEENAGLFVPIPYKSVSGHFIMMGFLPDSATADGKTINVYTGISEVEFEDYYDAVLPKDFNERIDED